MIDQNYLAHNPFHTSRLSSYKADFDSRRITGLINGDPITTWTNSGPVGGNLTQAGALRPLYRPTGINGLPSVEFDGLAQYMIADALAAQVSGTQIPFTVATINYLTGTTVPRTPWCFASGLSINPVIRNLIPSNNNAFARTDDTNATFQVSNGAATNSPEIKVCVFDGATMFHYVNRRAVVSLASVLGPITLNQFTLGVLRRTTLLQYWQGQFGRLVFFNAALNSNDVFRLINKWAWEWRISL